MPFDAGSVVVGVQIGGLTSFVSGWAAAAASVAKAVQAMGAEIGKHIEDTIKLSDEFGRLNAQTGLSVEFWSKLKYQAQMTDANFEGVAESIKRAVREGKIAGGEDGLGRLFDQLANIKDPTERARQAFEIFGRTSSEILPLITGNMRGLANEAERLGVVFTPGKQAAFGVLADEMDRAQEATRGFWTEISAQLAPSLRSFYTLVANVLPAITAWIERNHYIADTIQWVADKVGFMVSAMLYSAQALGAVAKSWIGTVGYAALEVGKAISSMAQSLGKTIKTAVDQVTSMSTGLGSEAMQRMFGISPDQLQSSLDTARGFAVSLSKIAKDARDTGLDMGATITEIGKAAQVGVEGFVEKAKELRRSAVDAMSKIGGLAGEGGAPTSVGTGGPAGGVEDAVDREEKTKAKRLGIINSFASAAGGVWQNYMKQGKGAFDALGKAFMETAASMAMSEGMYHFLAGLAMMFTPGLQAQGSHRMINGAMLMALGAALGAIGGVPGGSPAGGGGGGTTPDYDKTPGGTVDDEKRKPTLTIQVLGSMFDTRETWQRIAELSKEHSDHDIRLAPGSVFA